jgi:hypothetical protein
MVKIYKGSLAVIRDGLIRPADKGLSVLGFAGVAVETADTISSDKPRSCLIAKTGAFVFKADDSFTPKQEHVGMMAFASSDWEVTVSPDLGWEWIEVGTITAIESTSTGQSGVRIRIDKVTI